MSVVCLPKAPGLRRRTKTAFPRSPSSPLGDEVSALPGRPCLNVGRAQYKPNGRPGCRQAWLKRITFCRIADYFRNRSRQPQSLGEKALNLLDRPFEVAKEEKETPLDRFRGQALEANLRQVQAELGESAYYAFYQSVVEERPSREIALEMRITPAAVRKLKSQFLFRLRQLFSK